MFAQDILVNSGGPEVFCRQSSHIDLTDRLRDFSALSFDKEDICIVSVPSYGGKVPATAASRLTQMKEAVLIVAYGNRAHILCIQIDANIPLGQTGLRCSSPAQKWRKGLIPPRPFSQS